MAPVAWEAIVAFGFGFGALITCTLRLVEGSRLAVGVPDLVAEARLTDAHVPDKDIAGQPLLSSVQFKHKRHGGERETDFLANVISQGHRYFFLPVSASCQSSTSCVFKHCQEEICLTRSDMSLEVLIASEAGLAV